MSISTSLNSSFFRCIYSLSLSRSLPPFLQIWLLKEKMVSIGMKGSLESGENLY